MLGRQAQHRAAFALAVDGLVGPAAQAVLVAGGHQRKAGGRAHGRVGVALCELETRSGELVEHRRDLAELRVAAAVAAEVGKAEVIGHDEDDVGPFFADVCHVLMVWICTGSDF